MTKAMPPTLALVVGLAAGYWLGRGNSGSQHQAEPFAAAVSRPVSRAPTAVPANEIPAVEPDFTGGGDDFRLGDIIGEAPNPDRDAELRLALARASAAEIYSTLQWLRGAAPNSQRDRDLCLVYEMWARLDPRAALDHAEHEPDPKLREMLIANAVHGGMYRDPDGAFAWVSVPGRNEYAVAALECLARIDPQRALQFASTLPRDNATLLQGAYWAIVEAPLHHGNYSLSRDLIDRVSDQGLRMHLAARLVDAWARYQPLQAAKWAVTLPDAEGLSPIVVNVASIWAAQHPQEAASFAASLPRSSLRRQMLTDVVLYWSSQDLVAAGEWLNQFDFHPDHDPSIAAISTSPRFMEKNPETALAWAEGITTENTRTTAIRTIVQDWASRDIAAARHYIENTTALTPEQRAQWLATLTHRSLSKD